MSKRQKLWLRISGSFFIIGIVIMSIVAYFLIQTLRESFYQNAFEKNYKYISLEEDGIVDTVQVFHGVKINTFVQKEEKPSTIILELNDEEEAKLKGHKVNPDIEGMQAYSAAVSYKRMKNKESGKEQFIVGLQTSPVKEDSEATYRTYSINENGIVKESDFTTQTKSKLETQWIRGISEETHGYYTDLPYQDGAKGSLLFLSLMGVLLIISGFWVSKSIIAQQKEAVA
ncbi:hypothetical protein [Bacillus sp. es.034]|uniref:hypothetical protein n=1 Tax=Bacillus sp. es.034 TaxID=1761763 RepID=UPI000BF7FD68|nr:hypothetical protein [Bacillus sp. es.034]PFG04399.1 hypothetical protein ATG71_1143 [Bacillus sp. es.034]